MAGEGKDVPEAKTHLAGLYRTNPHEPGRSNYLRLDMNEGVPGLPESFVRQVMTGIQSESLAAYPEYGPLQEKIARHNQVSPENILLANGSDAAIKYIFDAYVTPQDQILLTDPTFAMYPVYCRMFAAEPLVVEYRPDLSFPLGAFKARLTADIRLAVIVNPNNPTGSVLPQRDLVALIAQAADQDILVILDEAYFYYYPETVIQQVKNFKNLIVLRTFSKLCGMAAARLGYATACPEIIDNLRKVRPTYDINGLAVWIGEKLLENPDIIQNSISETQAGKEFLVGKLAAAGIDHRSGEANFVLIKCKGKVKEIMEKLADRKVLVSGGFKNTFLQDYIRVTVGSEAVMKRFWQTFRSLGGQSQ